MEDERHLQLRLYNPEQNRTLIYLPGLHGDWTLIGGFRKALAGRVRFGEFTYPRTLEWSLDNYAQAIEEKLLSAGVESAWLLGESFGSQLVWPLLSRKKVRFTAAVLAGGFVVHPAVWFVRLGAAVGKGLPLRAITRVLFGYAKIARFRYRKEPAVLKGVEEFLARRTELDRQAAVHRLRLIAGSNPRAIARGVQVPIYAITGLFDPVVPWLPVRSWLNRNCPTIRDYRVIRTADHNVLGTASRESAEQVLRWMDAAP